MNSYILLLLALHAKYYPKTKKTRSLEGKWPKVTVQLAIFNERFVVEDLLEKVYEFDYPPQLLQIQILDDSTDDTPDIIRNFIKNHKDNCKFDVSHIRRSNRVGFKAGALEEATSSATGEFLALFDADFLPPKDFLKRTLPYFQENTACVQTRWGHTNADDSLFCKLQAIGHDGHFIIEQHSRFENDLLLNFNGTGGIWRKKAIEDAGGWSHETLAEDLDLSYRVQFIGYKIVFVRDIVVPAEIPQTISAFKKQQTRWAKGSLQCAVKFIPSLLSRSDYSLLQKFCGTFHLLGYLSHLFLFFMMLLNMLQWDLNCSEYLRVPKISIIVFLGPPLVCFVSRVINGVSIPNALLDIIPLLILFQGLCVNNAKAAWWVFFSWDKKQSGEFERTPKYGHTKVSVAISESHSDTKSTSGYLSVTDLTWEIILCCILTVEILYFLFYNIDVTKVLWFSLYFVSFYSVIYFHRQEYVEYNKSKADNNNTIDKKEK